MPHDRFYHPGPLKESLILEGPEHHHLFRVMRAGIGHSIEIIDGRGTLVTARIDSIDKKTAELSITDTYFEPPPPSKILVQSYLKQPKLELVLEKCTELGVSEFHLFPAERSERDHLSNNHQNRLHQMTLVATKQCGRLYIPTIHLHTALPPVHNAAYCTLVENPPPLHTLSATTVIIGPESGWTPSEETHLCTIAQASSLHSLILRAETAAITAAYTLSIAY